MGLQVKKGRSARLKVLLESLPDHFGEVEGDAIKLKTFTGHAIMEAVADTYACPPDLAYNELSSIVREAIKSILKSQQFTEAAFQEEADKQLLQWRSKPLETYRMWTRLNYKPARRRRIKLGDFDISIAENLSSELKSGWTDPSLVDDHLRADVEGGILDIKGKFRNSDSAGFKLSQVLDDFVGFLNFEYSRRIMMQYPESSRALFKNGPHDYLKLPSGVYADSVWTHPDFDIRSYPYGRDKERHFESGLKRLRAVQRRRQRNALTAVAVRCAGLLNSYYNSASNTDRLVLVWSCFEQVFTNQSDGSRGTYELIARRAARFDANPGAREALLLTLANRRNQAAHFQEATGSCHVAQEVARECALYMSWIINWILSRGTIFSSKQEFLDWVDIPKDRERLLRRLRLHNLAFSYWHPKQSDGEEV